MGGMSGGIFGKMLKYSPIGVSNKAMWGDKDPMDLTGEKAAEGVADAEAAKYALDNPEEDKYQRRTSVQI